MITSHLINEVEVVAATQMAADILSGEVQHQGVDVVLMLHGIGGNAGNFAPLMKAGIGSKDTALMAINLPGYGNSAQHKSTPHQGALSFKALSEKLHQLIQDTMISKQKLHLVGHSIGGMIALDYALSYGNVASLTLMGATPAFGGRDDSFKDGFLKARLGPLEDGLTMAEMAEQSAPHLVAKSASQDVIDAVAESLAEVPLQVWKQILNCLVTFNRWDDLGDVSCPVMVIAGDQDNNAPAKTLAKMADALPLGQFICLDDAGHILPLEAPEKIGTIISDFIEGL